MPRVLGGSWGGGRFLMGKVPLYDHSVLQISKPKSIDLRIDPD